MRVHDFLVISGNGMGGSEKMSNVFVRSESLKKNWQNNVAFEKHYVGGSE